MSAKDLAVWHYGSHARGDSDQYSDLDVLVVCDSPSEGVQIDELLGAAPRSSLSRYTWGEITAMAGYGSLFLQHLALEGRPVFEGEAVRNRLRGLLSSLGPYERADHDLNAFRAVLEDVRASLGDNGSLVFELSVVATVFRHASILGCSLIGSPCFSRTGAVAKVIQAMSLPLPWASKFPSLYVYRMHADGRVASAPTPTNAFACLWLNRSEALLNAIRRHVQQ